MPSAYLTAGTALIACFKIETGVGEMTSGTGSPFERW
jgi:hypothetical protein